MQTTKLGMIVLTFFNQGERNVFRRENKIENVSQKMILISHIACCELRTDVI